MAEPLAQAPARRVNELVLGGAALGALAALALGGLTAAQALLLCVTGLLLVLAGASRSLVHVTAVAMPTLAVLSILPAPVQIAGRNLRYMFIAVPLFAGLWMLRMARERRLVRVPHLLPLFALVAVLLAATLLRSPFPGRGLGTVALLAMNVAVYCLTVAALVEGGTAAVSMAVRWLFWAVAAYVLVGVVVVVGHVLGVLPRGFGIMTWDVADLVSQDVAGKVIVPLGFWTVTGSYFAATAVLGLGLLLQGGRGGRLVAMLGMVAGVVGMLLSYSRGPLLGFAVGLVALLVVSVRWTAWRGILRLGGILASLAAVAGLVLASSNFGRAVVFGRLRTFFDLESGTTADRLLLWARMLGDVRARPLLGSGADAYRLHRIEDLPAESWPMEILHSAGLVGLGLLLGWIGVMAVRAWRARGPGNPVASAAVAAFMGLNASVATNPGAWGTFYWVLAGMLAAAAAPASGPNAERHA